MSTTDQRCRLLVKGVVQGVGFRPFVYRCAVGLGLSGSARNTDDGVVVELEGPLQAITRFIDRLKNDSPPLSRVDSVREQWLPLQGFSGFQIRGSVSVGGMQTQIPPDVFVCRACLEELLDPADRRYRYPFINCTDCGPRFTIIRALPYDRRQTTMSDFPLCAECEAEYQNPLSRRFHAEPNACPDCGPRLWLACPEGREIPFDDPIAEAAQRLHNGQILAVKSNGGFHLAVDATNQQAVIRLRALKQRNARPFAVMARDLERIRLFATIGAGEQQLLQQPSAPIVLLQKRCDYSLAPEVAPGIASIGAMLPYTPLHHLLLRAFEPGVLVMTSANPRDEPIVRGNDEAIRRLAGIVDGYLFHNRDILARADDSVAMIVDSKPRLLRRSRGYTPLPYPLSSSGPVILAVGADLKNAFCVVRGERAFFGPHIGDLENEATADHFDEASAHLCTLLGVSPELIVHDLHPDYQSTRLAQRMSARRFPGARLMAVQHHQAHILSCLAEHRFEGPALGLALDGTGYGTDGTSWGCELLAVDGADFRRLGHLSPLALPGGDLAARQPWRIAVATLCELGQVERLEQLAQRWPSCKPNVLSGLVSLSENRQSHPRSSGLGRLFDLVSALLGIRDRNSYEGEAAIALECHATPQRQNAAPYAFDITEQTGRSIVSVDAMLRQIVAETTTMCQPEGISQRFHATVIAFLTELAQRGRRETGLQTIALSGGACQNRILLVGLTERLSAAGMRVLTQSEIPANDAGIALGQAYAGLLDHQVN